MDNLSIQFTPTLWHGMNEEEQAKALLFGHCRISVNSDPGMEIRKVIDTQLSYKELATWLKDNHTALLEERIPIGDSEFSSIAEAIARFYEGLDPDNENTEKSDRLYTYRVSHGVRLG